MDLVGRARTSSGTRSWRAGSCPRRGRHRSALAVRVLLPTLIAVVLLWPAGAGSETLRGALTGAYRFNPALRAQEANLRAVGENVSRARSGYLPKVKAAAEAGVLHSSIEGKGLREDLSALPRGVGLEVRQPLFDGGRTHSAVRQATLEVWAARETLRAAEQDTLYEAALAYANVLRDRAVLRLEQSIERAFQEQLRRTAERHAFGDVTRTDVSQAQARVAGARGRVGLAQASLRASTAAYRQVVGAEPSQLAPARPVDGLMPPSLDAALGIAIRQNPLVQAAAYGSDAARLQVNVTESELLPSVGVTGSVAQRYDAAGIGDRRFEGSVLGQLTIPIYSGGEVQARVRQAREVAGQRRLEAESVRDQVLSSVRATWAQLQAARTYLAASAEQVRAAEAALQGVRDENFIGERTTFDVLNAVQDVQAAWVDLLTAKRERVIATFAVARAVGRLSLGPVLARGGAAPADVALSQEDGFRFEATPSPSPLPSALRQSLAPNCGTDCALPPPGPDLRPSQDASCGDTCPGSGSSLDMRPALDGPCVGEACTPAPSPPAAVQPAPNLGLRLRCTTCGPPAAPETCAGRSSQIDEGVMKMRLRERG